MRLYNFKKLMVILLPLVNMAYAGNFMLMEWNGCDYQTCVDNLMVTQDSTQPPGCVQLDSSRIAGGIGVFDNRQDFSGVACGVYLNFYWDGNQYNYYQNNGNGQPLGWCGVDYMQSTQCLADDGGGLYNVQGVAWCQNYDETCNGVNPCVPC